MDFSFSKSCAHLRELKDAIKIRDTRAITDLLNNNPDIESNQLDDHQLIHQVVHYSCGNDELQVPAIEVLKLFLDFGVNVNVKDDEGCTVLHLAIAYRMRQVIDFLISRDADLNVRDKSGNSILPFLIKREILKVERSLSSNRLSLNENSIKFIQLKNRRKESADFVKWMILKGLDVDCQNNDGDTVLHYLLKNQRKYLAKVILNYSKNVDKPNKDGNTPLNIILDCDKDTSYEFTTEDEEIVFGLLEKGADIHKLNIHGTTPMINAVTSRNLSILQLFKKRGFNFCQSDNAGNLLHYFLKPKIAKDVQTQPSVLDLLIDEGCDVNGTDDEGRTPLHFAARVIDLYIVEKLIKCGSNVNSQDTRGYAPLHEAVEHSCEKVVTMLIKNGANVNIKTKKGSTPLFLINTNVAQTTREVQDRLRRRIAAFTGRRVQLGPYDLETTAFRVRSPQLSPDHRCITRKLLKHGAQIDVTDDNGYTPLHAAIRRGDADLMNELLRFGADINDNTHVLTARHYQLLEKSIGEHVIKLRVADLPVDDKLKYFPTFIDESYKLTHENSLVEVASLKSYKISDNMSLYDFLHLKRNITCLYVKNEKLMELLSLSPFVTQFPMYYKFISSTYYMAVDRQKILDPAKQAWLELTGIRLPDLCLYEIFNYVSNVTLRTMIEGAGLVLS